MTKFIYNNTKNVSISNSTYGLNYNYYLQAFFKKDNNFSSRFFSANWLINEVKNLMTIY